MLDADVDVDNHYVAFAGGADGKCCRCNVIDAAAAAVDHWPRPQVVAAYSALELSTV